MDGRSDKNPTSNDYWDDYELYPDEAPDFPYPGEEELIRLVFASPIDATELFNRKIAEWEEVRKRAKQEILNPIDLIDQEPDPFTKSVLRETIKIREPAERMREATGQIMRLKRLVRLTKRIFGIEEAVPTGMLSDAQVEQARAVPILDIVSQVVELRGLGNSHVGLCPFHQDRNPSFNVYPQQNRFYCFGCQKGGDAIDFIRLHYGYSFKKAIDYLTGGFKDD